MLAAARTLARAGFDVGAVADDARAAALWSRACRQRHVAPHPRADPAGFVGCLAQLIDASGYDVLIPGSDAAVMAVSRHRALLPSVTRHGLPAHDVVEASLDKRRLALAAEEAGFPTSPMVTCSGVDDAVEHARRLGYPVVLKPRSTVFADGERVRQRSARIVGDERQLRALAPGYGNPCIVEKAITGQTFSLGGVLDADGFVAVALARYDRTWPPLGGNASCATTVAPPPALLERSRRLLEALGWRGIFELEFIRRPDGAFFPIDLNPRPYGSLALASAAGAPPAVAWCRLLLGDRPTASVARAGVRYRYEEAELRHVAWSLRRGHVGDALAVIPPRGQTVHAYFSWRDPVPFAVRALSRGAQLRRRLTRASTRYAERSPRLGGRRRGSAAAGRTGRP